MSRYRCADVGPFQGIGLCLVHFHKGKGTHIIRVPPLERSICGQIGKKLGKIAKIEEHTRENRCPGTGVRLDKLSTGSYYVLYAFTNPRIPILWLGSPQNGQYFGKMRKIRKIQKSAIEITKSIYENSPQDFERPLFCLFTAIRLFQGFIRIKKKHFW